MSLQRSGRLLPVDRPRRDTGERAPVDAPYQQLGHPRDDGRGHRRELADGLRRGGSFYVKACSRSSTSTRSRTRRASRDSRQGYVRVTLTSGIGGAVRLQAHEHVRLQLRGGKASVGLQWRYLPSIRDESAARNPNDERARRRLVPVVQYVRALHRSTSGSSSAGASTTCSTRSRRSTAAARVTRNADEHACGLLRHPRARAMFVGLKMSSDRQRATR